MIHLVDCVFVWANCHSVWKIFYLYKSNKGFSIFKENNNMYYIEDDITFQDGIITKTLNLHTIGQIRVDYINNEIEVQIASFANRQDWVNDNAGKITGFIFKYEIFDFDVDPNLLAFRNLISMPNSLFYKKEIKKCYNMEDFYKGN